MDKSVSRNAVGSVSRYALASFGTPICAHVVEARRRVADKCSEHHCDTVAGIVFGCERRRRFSSVPVERRCHYSLGEVCIRKPVRPLSLTLEAARNSISAERFFVPAEIVEFGVSVKDIAHDYRHFNDKFPILVCGNDFRFCNNIGECFRSVFIKALFAVCFYPSKRLFIFFFIVNANAYSAEDFNFVNPFSSDTEVFLKN